MNDEFQNPWDTGGSLYPSWDTNQWAEQGPPQPGDRVQTTAINESAYPEPPLVAQPTAKTCWAAQVTMLVSWDLNRSFTIEQMLEEAGKRVGDPGYFFEIFYRKDEEQGIQPEELRKLLDVYELVIEPKSPTPELFASWLRQYGPIGMIGFRQGSRAAHGIVIYAILTEDASRALQLHYHNPSPITKGEAGVIADYAELMNEFYSVVPEQWRDLQLFHPTHRQR